MIGFVFVYVVPMVFCYIFYLALKVYNTPFTIEKLFDEEYKENSRFIFITLSIIPIINIVFFIMLAFLIVGNYFRKK